MKTNSSENTGSRWQKTPVANLVRNVQSGNYYARTRVRGKLIWNSLKTERISVAKLRVSDFHKEERQRANDFKASYLTNREDAKDANFWFFFVALVTW